MTAGPHLPISNGGAALLLLALIASAFVLPLWALFL